MKRACSDSSMGKDWSESIRNNAGDSILTSGKRTFLDSGGGFLLDVTDEKEKTPDSANPFPVPCDQEYKCLECRKIFFESYLLKNFNENVCDECKNLEEYQLMPKTNVLMEYLLTEIDLLKRDPPLKYVTRPNPHNSSWGEMKLFLKSQILKRALQKWGSMDNLEKNLIEREAKRLKSQTKKYKKVINQLRKNVRSSCYTYGTTSSHEHEFSSEVYNEEDDNYTKTCETCGFVSRYEKM